MLLKDSILGIFAFFGGLVILFILAWVFVLANIFTPGNVAAQWQFAYDYNNSLQATARQVCTAQQAVTAASGADQDTQNQRQSQLLAYENNYQRIEAEYDARLQNAFQAKLVKPADVPNQAPTLNIALTQVGCSQ